jgi:hypothetical protein
MGKRNPQGTVLVHVEGGNVQDVEGLPKRFDYQVFYWDDDDSIWPDDLPEYVSYILHDGRKATAMDIAARISDVVDRLDMGRPEDLADAAKQLMQRIQNAKRLARTDPEAFLMVVKTVLPLFRPPKVARGRSDPNVGNDRTTLSTVRRAPHR